MFVAADDSALLGSWHLGILVRKVFLLRSAFLRMVEDGFWLYVPDAEIGEALPFTSDICGSINEVLTACFAG